MNRMNVFFLSMCTQQSHPSIKAQANTQQKIRKNIYCNRVIMKYKKKKHIKEMEKEKRWTQTTIQSTIQLSHVWNALKFIAFWFINIHIIFGFRFYLCTQLLILKKYRFVYSLNMYFVYNRIEYNIHSCVQLNLPLFILLLMTIFWCVSFVFRSDAFSHLLLPLIIMFFYSFLY